MIGTEGTRLLREKRGQGRPRRRKDAEEAPGPPAESECLERKSAFIVQTIKNGRHCSIYGQCLFNVFLFKWIG
ncbi:hypothetical protein CMV16_07050 [Peribacillus simplex]|nr:hypothetical protein CMV16_07050 [Peribacillus simplex]PRA97240.1 hypothetical protein CQ056_00165 [Peribacillus simplex]